MTVFFLSLTMLLWILPVVTAPARAFVSPKEDVGSFKNLMIMVLQISNVFNISCVWAIVISLEKDYVSWIISWSYRESPNSCHDGICNARFQSTIKLRSHFPNYILFCQVNYPPQLITRLTSPFSFPFTRDGAAPGQVFGGGYHDGRRSQSILGIHITCVHGGGYSEFLI